MGVKCLIGLCDCVFFFNDTATTEIYTLSLHDALPIYISASGYVSASTLQSGIDPPWPSVVIGRPYASSSAALSDSNAGPSSRSEEHTSELQSRQYLVCRLLLEKKKTQICYL